MTTKRLCISADSHVVESAEFFKPLQKRFGDQAPRVAVSNVPRAKQGFRRRGTVCWTAITRFSRHRSPLPLAHPKATKGVA